MERVFREAWIVEAVRTPVGRYGGALASVRPDDLAAAVIAAVVDRSGIDPSLIEDVILGCANQAGEDNRNVARMALLLAGLPVEVAGLTVNRLCGSGLQAINSAAHAIAVGEGDVFIAGGVESMTRAPYVMAKPESGYDRGNREMFDSTLGWRFTNPRLAAVHYPYSMGETAENVAERWEVGRDLQDAFALESQRRAIAAIEEGRFDGQIVPISVPSGKGPPVVVDRDEHPRAGSSLEGSDGCGPRSARAARSRPAIRAASTTAPRRRWSWKPGWHAGSACGRWLGWSPRASRAATPRSWASVPCRPHARRWHAQGWPSRDLDLVELNEAFASQSIVCVNKLGLDPERVNVNGGAIALGHPLGMSGARMITTLVHELARRGGRYGLATMCIGVGQGIATIVERIDE